MQHDIFRDILKSLLGKVCEDVQSEPHLIPLENESISECERHVKQKKQEHQGNL